MKRKNLMIFGMILSFLGLSNGLIQKTSADTLFHSPFGLVQNTEISSHNAEYTKETNTNNNNLLSLDLRQTIKKASRQTGVPEKLLMAVIKKESDFNPNAISRTGARGLMQLMPSTAKWVCKLTEDELLDPEKNIMCGAGYLGKQLENFNDIGLALAAYNAGPGAVQRAIEATGSRDVDVITDALTKKQETAPYVQRILSYMTDYERG